MKGVAGGVDLEFGSSSFRLSFSSWGALSLEIFRIESLESQLSRISCGRGIFSQQAAKSTFSGEKLLLSAVNIHG